MTAIDQPFIEFRNVWKSFDKGRVHVLKGASLHVSRGETVAFYGASGCGKSTLLHLLAGFDVPDQGRITIDGKPVRTGRELTWRLRHQIGFVFQLHNLIPDLTTAENCLIPAVARRMKMATAEIRLKNLAEATGIAHRLKHRVQDLSGGERQRAALCRALLPSPPILLADEPTGSLDEISRLRVFELLMDLVRDEGITLLVATHDLELGQHCERIVRLRRGLLFPETPMMENSRCPSDRQVI